MVVKNADNDDIVLAITELTSENVKRKQISTLDPSRDHAEIIFENSEAEIMDIGDEGWGAVDSILNSAAVLMAFEQIGGAEALLICKRICP